MSNAEDRIIAQVTARAKEAVKGATELTRAQSWKGRLTGGTPVVSIAACVANINTSARTYGDFDIVMESQERYEAQKELDSCRSKVNRAGRLNPGVQVSTKKILAAGGDIVLRVTVAEEN